MHNKRKLTFATAAFILIGALVFFLLGNINQFLENKVKSGLESYINNEPGRMYDYDFESIFLNVFSGSVYLEKISIKPSKSALDSLNNNKISGLINLDINRLDLEGLSFYNLFLNKTIEVSKLAIADINIHYLLNDSVTSKKSPTSLHGVFSKELDHALLHEFTLLNASLSITKIHNPDSLFAGFDSTNIVLKEAYIDQESLRKLDLLTYEELYLQTKNIKGNIVKDYLLTVDSITIDSEKKYFAISSVHFEPKKFNYADTSKQFSRGVFIVDVGEIIFSDINLFERRGKEMLHIGKINVDSPSVTESTDRRWQKPMFERILPTANIRAIPIPVKIDTIYIQNGIVLYREFMPDKKPPFELNFSHTTAYGYNLTNDTLSLSSNPKFFFNAETKFMTAGNLSLNSSFDILSEREAFHINVKLDTMPLLALDKILEGQLNAKVTGMINAMEMNFNAHKYGTAGDLALDYSDLKLQTFKVKETKTGEKEINHWLINALINPIIKTNNNRDQVNFNTGIIEYKRPEDHSFFTMIWQSLKDGLVTTIMPDKRHREEKKERKEEIRDEAKID